MKNLPLIHKINSFYKLANQFIQINNPATQDVQFIKQTLQSLIQTYQPQIQQNPNLSQLINNLQSYLSAINQFKELNNTNVNYIIQVLPDILNIIQYLSKLEINRNPTLSQQLSASYSYLAQTTTTNFTQLTQQSSPQNNDDQTVQQYKTFFQNFKPEQLGKFLNMKGPNIQFFTAAEGDINSIPTQLQPMFKAFKSLSKEQQQKFHNDIIYANKLYDDVTINPANIGSTQNIKLLQSLINKFLQEKNRTNRLIQINGQISNTTQDAASLCKKLLELPFNTSEIQLFQKLKLLYPNVKPPSKQNK